MGAVFLVFDHLITTQPALVLTLLFEPIGLMIYRHERIVIGKKGLLSVYRPMKKRFGTIGTAIPPCPALWYKYAVISAKQPHSDFAPVAQSVWHPTIWQ